MKKAVRIVLRVLLGLVLALVLAFVVMMVIVPAAERPAMTPVPGSERWMADLGDDRLLSELVLPGTHDSATRNVQLAYITKCQCLGIGEQLEAGFRYLDIRLGVDEATGGLKLMHGFTNCTVGPWLWSEPLSLEAVLAECFAFLEANPSETVVFAVKYEHPSVPTAEFERMLDACILQTPEKWLLTDRLPTLGEARGKLVLFLRCADEAGLGTSAGIPFLWADQNLREDVRLHTTAEENGAYTLWVQDRFHYDAEEKWAAFTAGMENGAADAGAVSLNFLSTAGPAAYGHPYKYAKELNRRLMELDDLSGWIVLDFGTPALAEHIYASNFE